MISIPRAGRHTAGRSIDRVTAPLASYTEEFSGFGSEFTELFNVMEQETITDKPTEEQPCIGEDKQLLSSEEILRIAAERFVQSYDSPNSNRSSGVSFLESELPSEVLRDVELAEALLLSAKEVDNEKYAAASELLLRCDSLSSNAGTPVQRIVFHFSQALWKRIHARTVKAKTNGWSITQPFNLYETLMKDSLTALVLHEKLPFCQILQFVGVQAIVESMANAKKIHVIDLEIKTGSQWPILMQALASRNGPSVELLKITAVSTGSFSAIEETGKRLTSFAASLQIPFAFREVMVTDLLNLKEVFFHKAFDEKVAVYASFSLMTLLGFPDRLDSFMNVIRNMNPRIMFVAEVEANHSSKSFVNRFTEALFYNCAFFDCFETFMPRSDPHRMASESLYFGQGISNIVAAEGEERNIRHVKIDVWRKYFARFGMMEMEHSSAALHQAYMLVKKFDCKSSMTIDRDESSLILSWKGTPLFSLSVWDFL